MSRAKRPPTRPSRSVSRARSAGLWAGFIAVPLVLAVLVLASLSSEPRPAGSAEAIPFELAASDGGTVSLSQALARGDALLYFSMGVGCDGCFAQIPEIEPAIAVRGLTLLPIMVDPAPLVAAEAERFGIESPILIDPGARVSAAYGMVGIYGHSDRPSHSFALVRSDGTVAWVRHYPEMFVPAAVFLSELDAALDA